MSNFFKVYMNQTKVFLVEALDAETAKLRVRQKDPSTVWQLEGDRPSYMAVPVQLVEEQGDAGN